MGKTAFIFPGQGAQYIGMGLEMASEYPVARETFLLADEILGFKLSDTIFYGDAEELKKTEVTQPAIVATSVALLAVLRQYGIEPDGVAGLSLGEYSALIAAGSLTLEDTLPLVQKRGRYMQEAVPPGVGGMAAVLGLERSMVQKACREASGVGVVEPANYNSPDQIVVAGEIPAVRKACEIAKSLGAKRTVELPVSVSFHCSLLKGVEPLMERDLEQVNVKAASLPVVANVSAEYIKTPGQIREALVRQVSNAVMWQDSVEKLVSDGFDTFIEVGPGKSLTGLMKKIDPGVTARHMEDTKSLERVLELFMVKEEGRYALGG